MELNDSKTSNSKKKLKSRFLLFITIGCYCGLRASDLLRLKWINIVDKDQLEIKEQKTGKVRLITINEDLKEIIEHQYSFINPNLSSEYIFSNRDGNKHYSIQFMNRKFREILKDYGIEVKNPSTHTLRKTFGRRVFENNNRSDEALIILSQIFNHASTSITRRYIGLQAERIRNVYLNL